MVRAPGSESESNRSLRSQEQNAGGPAGRGGGAHPFSELDRAVLAELRLLRRLGDRKLFPRQPAVLSLRAGVSNVLLAARQRRVDAVAVVRTCEQVSATFSEQHGRAESMQSRLFVRPVRYAARVGEHTEAAA